MLCRSVRLGIYRFSRSCVRVRERRPVRASFAASRRGVPIRLSIGAGISDGWHGPWLPPGAPDCKSESEAMTRDELRRKLISMSDREIGEFCQEFGGGEQTRDQLVRTFVDHPEFERRMCQLLQLPTEDEKLTTAATSSARSARYSVIWASLSVLISTAALIVAILALLRTS